MTIGGTVAEKPRTLSDLRKSRNLGVQEVADLMGVNRTRVTAIEASYPNISYGTLLRYMSALGGGVRLVVAGITTDAADLVPDPEKAGTRKYMKEKNDQWLQRLNAERTRGSLPSEELPLQGDAAEPGGDDTGGQVDQPDAERDQGDSDQGQQV